MKWFYDMKIATKNITGFVIVALIAGIIGIVGYTNINTISKNDTTLYENMTVPISQLADIGVSFQRSRVHMRDMLMTNSEDAIKKESDNLDARKAEIEKIAPEYEKLIVSAEMKKMFEDFKTSYAEFQNQQDKIETLHKKGNHTEAIKILQGDGLKAALAANDIIDKMQLKKTEDANVQKKDNNDTANSSSVIMISFAIAGMALAVILGIFISRIISSPIKKLTEVAEKLSLGDVDVKVESTTKDEIGDLSKSFSKMIENVREQALAVEKVASGDLTIEINAKSEKDILGKKLVEMIETNNEILNNINSVAEQVAQGSKQLSSSGQVLSQGSTEQASSIEQITSSMAQVANQTNQNATNATQADKLAVEAKENAVQGNSQMKGMVQAMTEINESSANISNIIKVIDEIAFQTNILALNAAVEAARAGQHGKGFAVVAEEVRNLAARSANAAKETTSMIENSINKVKAGTKIVNDTAQALDKIVDGITKAAVLVGDIAVASNDQANGIAQVNQAIEQVGQVVQTNSATAEESASASEELSSQADILKNSVNKFKLKKQEITAMKIYHLKF